MPLTTFSAIMSAFCMLCYNIPFFQFVTANNDSALWQRLTLIAGLTVVMFAINFWVCYLLLFLTRYVGRILIAFTHIASATGVYFVWVYQTLLDGTMMENFYHTRWSEASTFFSIPMFLWIFFTGVLPAAYVLIQHIDYGSWKRFGITSAIAVGISLVCALTQFNQFLWFGRYDTQLGGLLMPWSYIVNSGRLAAQYYQANREEEPLPDASLSPVEKPIAVILVIGESARSANFQLYGYSRATNPLLSSRSDLHVLPARSCATYTSAAVTAMMQHTSSSTLYEALPNYLFRHGVDVVWRSNNWGEPPVHIDEFLTMRDLRKQYPEADDKHEGVLFAGIKQRIEASDSSRVFIVLHTSTSHGAQYDAQYPNDFQVFRPVCHTVEEGRENLPGLINAYDNSIIYTDYLLNSLIDSLATIHSHNCALIYMSDHGESLGENGLFMHGVPMRIAPREQYEIPCLIWLNNPFIHVRSFEHPVDQQYIYHSVLHLLQMQSPIYESEKDFFENERQTE